MRYLFFIGTPHHKIHTRFIHSLLGGEYIIHECVDNDETDFPREVFEKDGEDAIWFFPDLFINLHPRLKGKQVFIGHGLNFPPWLNSRRAECINNHIDMVFENGLTQGNDYRKFKIDLSKIKPVGYTTLFEIPNIPAEENAVLFSSTYFAAWNHDENMRKILEVLDARVKGYVAIHPSALANLKKSFVDICEKKGNIKFIRSQEELLEAYAICSYNVNGGSSSICSAFWYQKKPVVLVRGPWGRNPIRAVNWDWFFKRNDQPLYKGCGWKRIENDTHEPLFSEILGQSLKISHWKQFDWNEVRRLKPAPSATKVFYPWSHDKEETKKRIFQYVKELERSS